MNLFVEIFDGSFANFKDMIIIRLGTSINTLNGP